MKFNWGHGIALFYILFVSALGFALYKSFGVNHNLVMEDYYKQDIEYQKHFDEVNNYLKDGSASVEVDQSTKKVVIKILGNKIKGDALFYRPSDKSLDFNVPIVDNVTDIDIEGLLPGRWKVKVSWDSGNKPYYMEKEIVI